MIFGEKIVIGSTQVDLWRELITEGQKISGNKLSENAEYHLISAFIGLLKDKELVGEPIATMHNRANNLRGTLKAQALERVGNISLMRAGFLPLVSKHFKRTLGHTVPYFISFGRSSFYGAKITHESLNRTVVGDFYSTLVSEFVLLVEVLWALQKNGYPELLELIEVSNISGARHSKEKAKQLTNGIILDIAHT